MIPVPRRSIVSRIASFLLIAVLAVAGSLAVGPSAQAAGTASISGTITAGGQPVANAWLQLTRQNGTWVTSASSLDNGSFSIGDLAAGSYRLRVSGMTSEWIPQDVPFSVTAGQSLTGVSVVLEESPDLVFHARVLDAGVPVPDVSVSVRTAGRFDAGNWTNVTGPDGTVAISGLYSDVVDVSVFANGIYRPFTATSIPVTDETFQIDIQRIPTGTASLSGIVKDAATDAPIAQASVFLSNTALPASHSILTDESGFYSFNNLAPGSWQLSVTKGGVGADHGYRQANQFVNLVDAQATVLPVHLVPVPTGIATVRGTLLEVDGTPIPATRVSFRIVGDVSFTEYSGLTDENGVYEIENLPAGRFLVGVTEFSGNFAQLSDSDSALTIPAGVRLLDKNLRLHRFAVGTGGASGVVTDPRTGDPVAGAWVSVSPKTQGLTSSRSASTNADGSWDVSGLPDGTYMANVSPAFGAGGWEWADSVQFQVSGGLVVPVTLTLTSVTPGTGTLSGVLRDDLHHTRVAEGHVTLYRDRGGFQQNVATDSSGRFSFTELPAGRYWLGATADGYDYSESTSVQIGAAGVTRDVGLRPLPADGDGVIRVALKTIEGDPAIGVYVSATPLDQLAALSGDGWGYSAQTNDDGIAELTGVLSGNYILRADSVTEQGGEIGFVRRVTVQSGAPAHVFSARLSPPQTLSGSLALGAGENFAFVEAIDATTGEGLGFTNSDEDGNWQFSGLPIGSYKIAAFGDRGDEPSVGTTPSGRRFWRSGSDEGTVDPARATTIDVGAGAIVTGLDIRMTPGASVTGRVTADAPGVATAFPASKRFRIRAYAWSPSTATWILDHSLESRITAPDGSFTVRALPVGQLRLQFVDEATGPRATAPEYYLDSATLSQAASVTTTAGTTQTLQDVRLAPVRPVVSAAPVDLDTLPDDIRVGLADQISLSPSPRAGMPVVVTVGTRLAGEWLSIQANSAPTVLADWQQVTAAGTVSVTLPSTLTGSHRILAVDAAGHTIGWRLAQIAPAVPGADPGTDPGTGPGNGPTTVPVYRFWSPLNSTHFYTTSATEKAAIQATYPASVWTYEKVAYRAFDTQQPGTVPLYRFWSPKLSGHFFTANEAEKQFIQAHYPSSTWTYEKIAYWVYPADYAGADATEVYRFWSPKNQHHFFTSSAQEKDVVRTSYPTSIWTFEGTGFKVPTG